MARFLFAHSYAMGKKAYENGLDYIPWNDEKFRELLLSLPEKNPLYDQPRGPKDEMRTDRFILTSKLCKEWMDGYASTKIQAERKVKRHVSKAN